MSTQHVIHHVIAPGLAGDGFTAPEAAAVRDEIARVVPPAPGSAADQLRVTVNGPRWLPPDTVSPLLFDAAGDGTTDDYAAIMQAYDSLGTSGGTINLGGRAYRSNSTLAFATGKMVHIDGGVAREAGGSVAGGGLTFPDGIDGIVCPKDTAPILRNLGIRVAGIASSRAAGTGHGVTIHSPRAHLDNVRIQGFGGNGLHVASHPDVPGVNANMGQANQVDVLYCGGHGMYFEGGDSNVWTVVGANLIFNRGYGILNGAQYHNTFLAPHAFGNFAGDFMDDGWSSMWLNPYSENAGDFDIGKNSDRCTLMMTGYASPNINYRETATGTKFAYNGRSGVPADPWALSQIGARGWTITRHGELLTRFRNRLHLDDSTFEIRMERNAPGEIELMKGGDSYFLMGGLGETRSARIIAPRIGFYGGAAIAKPTVTGAKGGNAALTSLITALKNLGLITDSTT